MEQFDYILIGAGTAGCVLANRLSERAGVRVLVLEAGGEPTPEVAEPNAWIGLMGSALDWQYRTEPQPGLLNQQVEQPRGRVLGGTGSINGMLYTRPLRYDFDQWAYQGAAGWDYDSMLPFFQRVENFTFDPDPGLGHEGALHLVSLKPDGEPHEFYRAFIAACAEHGYPFHKNFSNSQFTEGGTGAGWFAACIKDGRRHSAYEAYLEPARGRDNLEVWTGAQALRLCFDQRRCVGVEIQLGEQREEVRAAREVIVCAGSIESPKLLLLSGIGPAGELAELEIPLQANVPGVGKNFHDHVTVTTRFALAEGVPDVSQGLCRMALFAKSNPDMLVSDLEYLVLTDSSQDENGRPHTYLSLHTSVQRPLSKGWVRLASTDPCAAPRIHPNLLAERTDVERLMLGVEKATSIAKSTPLQRFVSRQLQPDPAVAENGTLENFVRENAKSQWHICGSCKMGIDDLAVVDPELRVRGGVEGLRVCDSSIWPTVVTGHAQSSMMAIAERASQLILKDL